MAGALAGSDDRVGAEEFNVAYEFGNRPILHDSVRAMLDMRIGENTNAVRRKFSAIAGRLCGRALDESFIGDISIGPLIDPNEARAGGARHREGV